MGPKFWLAVIRGIGGLLLSAAAVYAAWDSTKRDTYRRYK